MSGLSVDSQAAAINGKTEGAVEASALDPACYSKESDGHSVAEKLATLGIPCIKIKKEGRYGYSYSIVKAFLRPVEGKAKLTISSNCVQLIQDLETTKWENATNDDLSDALRYLLSLLTMIPVDSPVPDSPPSGVIKRSDGSFESVIPQFEEEITFDNSGYLNF